MSFSSEHYFVGLAVANLNYLTNPFFYVVDTRTGKKVVEYSTLSPFPTPQLKSFSATSITGCTEWQSGTLESLRGINFRLSMCGDAQLNTVIVLLDYVDGHDDIKIHVTCSLGEALALLYPISASRPAYTHKEVAMKTTGTISVNKNQEAALVSGIDWTYSLAKRVTIWKWCFLQTILDDGMLIARRKKNKKEKAREKTLTIRNLPWYQLV
eukprot:TRINITY_DN3939_c0_g1_i2.p1 TRINITY_DN3939_c0_g1~~TRINITY_DN3939_c0_g1_i2.p1  ORF type:complete len:211 (-),score=34.99 TRINITY_DN3939_c0_g1_i2:371-1003(-)